MINSVKVKTILTILSYCFLVGILGGGCQNSVLFQVSPKNTKTSSTLLQRDKQEGLFRHFLRRSKKGPEITPHDTRAVAEKKLCTHLIDCVGELFKLDNEPFVISLEQLKQCSESERNAALEHFFKSFASDTYCHSLGKQKKCFQSLRLLVPPPPPPNSPVRHTMVGNNPNDGLLYGIALHKIAIIWHKMHVIYSKVLAQVEAGTCLDECASLLLLDPLNNLLIDIEWFGSISHNHGVVLDRKFNSSSCLPDNMLQSSSYQQGTSNHTTVFERCLERATHPIVNVPKHSKDLDFKALYVAIVQKTSGSFNIETVYKIMRKKYSVLLALIAAMTKVPALLEKPSWESVHYATYFDLEMHSSNYGEFDTIRQDYYRITHAGNEHNSSRWWSFLKKK